MYLELANWPLMAKFLWWSNVLKHSNVLQMCICAASDFWNTFWFNFKLNHHNHMILLILCHVENQFLSITEMSLRLELYD